MSGSSIGQIGGAIVGGVIGFVTGGPAGALRGASIGYTLGGIVDPPPGPNIEGPRLNDKKITVSTYGEDIPLVYGPRNRLSGNVIWSTGLIETKKTEKSGGKGGGGSTTTTYSYRMSLAIMLSGRPAKGVVKAWANGKVLFELPADSPNGFVVDSDPVNGTLITGSGGGGVSGGGGWAAWVVQTAIELSGLGSGLVFNEIHFYPGSAVQVPDPWIESIEGAGNVPAYRHETYVVIKDLQLADFGNRMPNLEFELVADDSITLAQVLHDITDRCNIQNASVFGLTQEVDGYIVSRGNGSGAIASLATAYFFDITEQRGQIRFVKRGNGLMGTIPIEEMGARQADENPITPINYEKLPTTDLPKQMNVTFADPALDYQNNTQRAFRDQGASDNISSVELPLTLTADQGRQIADRLLWLPWTARRQARTTLDDTWVRANPGGLYGIPVAGQVLPYKLTRMTRGDNGVIQAELQQEDLLAYQSAAAGSAGRLPVNELRLPGETRLILMDAPIWQDSDDNAGFYWVVTAESRFWRGASILRSSDLGVNYEVMSPVGVRTTLGDVAAATPTGPVSIWDRTNVITVVLAFEDDELESVSELRVLNGANAAWLGNPDGQGGEWLQFATATLVAPQTYELSDLLRGRLGTEANVGTHGPNEVLVMATESSTGRTDFGPGDWDIERLYKPVSTLTDQQDVTEQAFTNFGAGKTPYSPVHITGERDGSNNLTVSCIRRTRLRVPGLGGGNVPLGETSEAYEWEFIDGASPPNVLRTVPTTSPTVDYTAAEQTSDGLTPGDPVSLRVYQISDIRGRGYPGEATV